MKVPTTGSRRWRTRGTCVAFVVQCVDVVGREAARCSERLEPGIVAHGATGARRCARRNASGRAWRAWRAWRARHTHTGTRSRKSDTENGVERPTRDGTPPTEGSPLSTRRDGHGHGTARVRGGTEGNTGLDGPERPTQRTASRENGQQKGTKKTREKNKTQASAPPCSSAR
jgi:hypothetical protein